MHFSCNKNVAIKKAPIVGSLSKIICTSIEHISVRPSVFQVLFTKCKILSIAQEIKMSFTWTRKSAIGGYSEASRNPAEGEFRQF